MEMFLGYLSWIHSHSTFRCPPHKNILSFGFLYLSTQYYHPLTFISQDSNILNALSSTPPHSPWASIFILPFQYTLQLSMGRLLVPRFQLLAAKTFCCYQHIFFSTHYPPATISLKTKIHPIQSCSPQDTIARIHVPLPCAERSHTPLFSEWIPDSWVILGHLGHNEVKVPG